MKCLFVGVFSEGSTNNSQAACLQKHGVDTVMYDYREKRDLLGIDGRDAHLSDMIREKGFDFVLIAKGRGISADVIKKSPCRTILWYPDTMNSNWNDELIKKIKVADVVACAWTTPAEKAKLFNKNSHRICEGFDPEIDKPIKSWEEPDWATFIGQNDGTRQPYMRAQFHPTNHRRSRIKHINNAYGIEHSKAVGLSLINLNFTRQGGSSDRVYKVLAAGGFLLTQPWPGMEQDFEPHKDFALFDGVEDMAKKIEYYLENPVFREVIQKNGTITVQKFSRMKWAERIIDLATTD